MKYFHLILGLLTLSLCMTAMLTDYKISQFLAICWGIACAADCIMIYYALKMKDKFTKGLKGFKTDIEAQFKEAMKDPEFKKVVDKLDIPELKELEKKEKKDVH